MSTPLRICVVENHTDTREVLGMLLTMEGHQVATADRCESARALFGQQDFDVLLSDIGLQDGDGWQLLGDLRRAAPGLFAVAMTGYGNSSDVEKSRAAGFRQHLVKPVDMVAVRRLLDEAAAELHADATRGA